MRVVSWNCHGAFRKKWQLMDACKADICIIQECENPAEVKDDAYREWSRNHLWVGTSRHRGLAVIAAPDIELTPVSLPIQRLELFLPCRINQDTHMLAVWTKQADSPTFKYIGQLWKWLQAHADFLRTDKSLLIGDLNSNAQWDVWDRWWNHSDVVEQLSQLGLSSLYHQVFQERQGHESLATFYMNRKLARGYHIDYAFLSSDLLPRSTLELGLPADWLPHSDHMPLIVDMPNLQAKRAVGWGGVRG